MDASLVEKITEMVLKELHSKDKEKPDQQVPTKTAGMVKLHGNLNTVPDFSKYARNREEKETPEEEPAFETFVDDPKEKEQLLDACKKTPARIGIGRAGVRPKTKTLLKFRLDHAAAVDAVYGEVTEQLLEKMNWFSVQTMVQNQEEYIRRPDLGRKLSEEAKKKISETCVKAPQVQVIISDGLSSEAIEKNVEDVYLSLQQSLNSLGLKEGTPFFIKNGRVAVMDEIGEILEPEVAVLLIGERPGLVSAESLSAYLCYKPRKGTIEADRMVISNIHEGGIPPVEAGAYLGSVIQKILKYEASGVSLVKKER
ncbi:ethanolamine ammonia-lyase subunit EutC [Fictibacillus gelatini]|uniref:ethanolamine ammonia-lyase subunit EutC n=1 Tax=Fictibacillus gelatini TaxID=225985 RepID=UPI000428F404|nr:ethanolamine ammonia-lyase subunit EutC [Fictibacillus gelatini]